MDTHARTHARLAAAVSMHYQYLETCSIVVLLDEAIRLISSLANAITTLIDRCECLQLDIEKKNDYNIVAVSDIDRAPG